MAGERRKEDIRANGGSSKQFHGTVIKDRLEAVKNFCYSRTHKVNASFERKLSVRCQSTTCGNGTDNNSDHVIDHYSRRTESTESIKKLDSQELISMDLDNPTDQLRRIWQNNLEFSRLRCFTSNHESMEVLGKFHEENLSTFEYWERRNEIVYKAILPVSSYLYDIENRQRTKNKGLRDRQIESTSKELTWIQEFQRIILERIQKSNISCLEITLTPELEFSKEEQMKTPNPNKFDYLDIWRRHMDICTGYVNLQRDTLNKVDHLRVRILIVVDLEVSVTQKSQEKVTYKEVWHEVVN